MKLKEVIPDMEKTFGTLGFGGEGDVRTRRVNGQRTVVSRTYHLFSTVQKADDVVVKLPGKAGEKKFEFDEEISLVNPRMVANGRQIGDDAFVSYMLEADDIVARA